MKRSYLMTVHNREYEVLLSTLRSLSRADMADSEVVVVNDLSTFDYTGVIAYGKGKFERFQWIDMEPYEAFTLPDGSKCPSKAFNRALAESSGTDAVIMSSDTLVGPRVVERLKRIDLNELAWTPMVLDLDSGQQYCGPMRLFPAPWCLATTRKHLLDIKGWDEAYMDGTCFEDNDFIGRLMLHVGRFLGDWTVAAFHQSHYQAAYDTQDERTRQAWERNRQLTMAKWGGIPFHPEYISFDVLRKPWRTGDIVHECRGRDGLLEKAIELTLSPGVPACA